MGVGTKWEGKQRHRIGKLLWRQAMPDGTGCLVPTDGEVVESGVSRELPVWVDRGREISAYSTKLRLGLGVVRPLLAVER